MKKKLVKKVFVVDDSEFESNILQDYITTNTMHKVQVFDTGEDCLRNLGEEPDVIILDYTLNSVKADAANGGQILNTLKKLAPGIHVVMLSSQDDYGVALQTVMKGADTYIVKDLDAFEKIVRVIHELD